VVLENAGSTAGVLVLTEVTLIEVPERQTEAPQPVGMD
jgi:hypothetical protein